jgi:V/A-type H+/Na+-transporting ATPase subunit D
MALRIPPGRAGRQWLTARIATAEHARDVLEQKRTVLIGAERDAAARAAGATARWHAIAGDAARWLERSAILDGERPRRLAHVHAGGPAAMSFSWQTTMGVGVPTDASVVLAPSPDAALLPGGAALTSAISAHRAALDAALLAAVENAAHERLAAELVATVRRVRAIESRWLPLHQQALAALEQTLDENDRAEGARIRWARHRLRRLAP